MVVVVETVTPGNGPAVTTDHRYRSMVTLYIENTKDKSKTPSGWSTRKEHGADQDEPFVFQPGRNLIQGWTEGVLKMKEGERALLHVPAAKGYGSSPMGSQGTQGDLEGATGSRGCYGEVPMPSAGDLQGVPEAPQLSYVR